ACDFVEQPLELGDIAVDRLLEATIGAVFARDFVERLLAGGRVEPFGERLALAALIAVPHFGGEVAIHQPADVERQRLQRIGGGLRRAATRRFASATAAVIGAVEEVGQPSVAASSVLVSRRNRRGFGAARGRYAEVRRR